MTSSSRLAFVALLLHLHQASFFHCFILTDVVALLTLSKISRFCSTSIFAYYVKDDDEMMNLQESIKENGVLSPLIVRPLENDEYEVISGHRRLHASKKARAYTSSCLDL